MAQSNSTMIHKLQNAINQRGERLLYNKQQFYSNDQDRPVTIYYIKKSVWDVEKHRNHNEELFKSCSQIQIVLFLRDYWYMINGWELPTENEMWNDIRSKIEVFNHG